MGAAAMPRPGDIDYYGRVIAPERERFMKWMNRIPGKFGFRRRVHGAVNSFDFKDLRNGGPTVCGKKGMRWSRRMLAAGLALGVLAGIIAHAAGWSLTTASALLAGIAFFLLFLPGLILWRLVKWTRKIDDMVLWHGLQIVIVIDYMIDRRQGERT